jgi:thiol:disulfide interchange protein
MVIGRQACGVWRNRTAAGLACLLAVSAGRAAVDPFSVDVTARNWTSPTGAALVIRYAIPGHHYLYASSLTMATVPPVRLTLRTAPAPVSHDDPQLGATTLVYHESFEQVWAVEPPLPPELGVTLKYQGCGPDVCFLPQTRRFVVTAQGVQPGTAEGVAAADTPVAGGWLAGWRQAGTTSGYLGTQDFLAFLDQAEGVPAQTPAAASSWRALAADPVAFARAHGLLWTLLLVVVGGLLLNLTPCVLPMIPINLGIIGAGAQNGSRRRGLLLGGAYGAGIAIVYGALGLVVVLTGSVFGSLQGSPWFNAGIAALFLVLALALFDVIVIDLTRFQRSGTGRGRYGAAFAAGGISALLAGACVAPVVVAVLVLSGALYAQGEVAALALPFLLGVGMALPWPFAGAGLSWLPRPGRWMVWVKYGFGILVVVLAAYYGRLAWNGFRPAAPRAGSLTAGDETAWQAALAGARAQGRPVFVDFWATWCKNCTTMEHTTFRDPVVVARLAGYTVLQVQSERPDIEPARSMLRALGVNGLPTYLVINNEAAVRQDGPK